MSNRTYTFDRTQNSGNEPCNILIQLYENENFRAVAIRKEDLESFDAWRLCQALQNAYEAGRKDAMSDLRNLIGVK
jgi:hypothetical protein